MNDACRGSSVTAEGLTWGSEDRSSIVLSRWKFHGDNSVRVGDVSTRSCPCGSRWFKEKSLSMGEWLGQK